MRFRSFLTLVIGMVAAAGSLLAADSGRDAGVPRPGAVNLAPVVMGTIVDRPSDFGPSGDAVSTFYYVSFKPIDSVTGWTAGGDAVWPKASGALAGTILQTNLQVPEGAVIDYTFFSFCKSNTNAVSIIVGGNDSGADFSDLNLPSVMGCFWVTGPLIGHAVAGNTNHAFSVFANWLDSPLDGSVRLQAAEVWWHRSVSTGPVTADFSDVPTSDPRYNFVEAVFGAGITAGCGAGRFCPDQPLTRGQMAVFLAKALGLYWPNVRD